MNGAQIAIRFFMLLAAEFIVWGAECRSFIRRMISSPVFLVIDKRREARSSVKSTDGVAATSTATCSLVGRNTGIATL
jgi:hypothetical protein